MEVRVFFASKAGVADYEDKNFGRSVRWEGIDIGTFPHEFLSEQSVMPSPGLDAPSLGEKLSAYRPNALLVYGYNQRLQRRARRWAVEAGVPLLMFSDSELRQHRSLLVRAAKKIVLPAYFRSVDVFLTTGDANEAYYRNYGVPDRKMVRAPYPIDRDAYAAASANRSALRAERRRTLGLADDRVLCCMVGKFVSWKRQRDAVDMLAHPGTENVELLLVGSGVDEQELRAAGERVAPGRVHFAGFTQPRDLPACYAAADIYVHTSEVEPHSVAVSEAVFMGCPVIISDRCGSWGPTDDVQLHRNGSVYRCGDIAALARAVGELATDAELRSRYGVASQGIGAAAQALSHGDGWRAALDLLALS